MAFKYVAYDSTGTVIEGTMKGPSEYLVKETLQSWGYNVVSLNPTRQRLSLRQQIPTLFKVKAKDLIIFSRLLATLVERGTTTFVALQLISDQTANVIFKEVLHDVFEDIRHGRSLSDAMSQHPEVFSTLYCRMIKVGEQTGNLESVLRQTADYLEKESALLSKVARALTYPAIVMLIACGVIVLLMTFVLPSFADLFAEFEGQIPLPTRLLMGLSDFMNQNKLILIVLALGASLLAVWSLKNSATRRWLDALLLRMPLMGSIISFTEMARCSRLVSLGLSESLPMPETLEIAAQVSQNRRVAEALENVSNEVTKGRSLSQSMMENPLFPKLLVQLDQVGEETANLEESLKAVAETYEAEADRRVSTIISLIEPGIIVFIGVIVAFIAISVILPTYSLLGEF